MVLAWNVGFGFAVTLAVLPALVLAGLLVFYALWREGRRPA